MGGCSSGSRAIKTKVTLDAELQAECQMPPERAIKDNVDALEFAADLVEALIVCKEKHGALVRIIDGVNNDGTDK